MTRHAARMKERAPLLALTVLGFLALLAAEPAAAQQQPLIAALPFEGVQASAAEARAAHALFEGGLRGTRAWNVLSQEERDRILAGQEIEAADCADERCAVEIGRLLGAQQVALGTLARAGSGLIINAKIIDVASSQVLAADSISAATQQELEGACRVLARRLTARARPGVVLAEDGPQGREPAAAEGSEASAGGPLAAGGGVEATTGAASSEGVGKQGETPGTVPGAEGLPETSSAAAVPPEAEGPPDRRAASAESGRRRGRLWVPLTGSGAALFGLLGNVSASLSFELRRSSDEAYEDYMAAVSNFDALWNEYKGLHAGYAATTIGAYSCWALAAAAPPLHFGLYGEEAFQLTPLGRRLYTWGTALTVAGSIVDLVAAGQRYTVDFLYEDYLSAGADWDRLYDRYAAGYAVYLTERILSYALWGLGALGAGGAFFLRGDRQPAVEGFLEKSLVVAGAALMSAGGVTRTVALNARQEHANSGGSDEQAYERYVGYAVASCLLWAAGGAAMLWPVVREPRVGPAGARQEADQRPAQLRLMPAPGGLLLQVAWSGRGRRDS